MRNQLAPISERRLTFPVAFSIHEDLIPYFQRFQGCKPSKAKHLIIGKDANFLPEFNEDHEIWNSLKAYLGGNRDWLSRGGRAERSIHHPSLLNSWLSGSPYHSYFAKLFDILTERGCREVNKSCSFVELICWPTTGNITQALEAPEDLFAGQSTEDIPVPLRSRFQTEQRRHLRRLRNWINNCKGTVLIPKSAFDMICGQPKCFPEIVRFQNHVMEDFREPGNWLSITPGESQPRMAITKHFPYFNFFSPRNPPRMSIDQLIAKLAAALYDMCETARHCTQEEDH